MKILLVEDNQGDARLIKEMLSETDFDDYNIDHSTTLSEALSFTKRNGYDIVLLDLGLPDSSGLESVSSFSQSADHIPIIVLTGLSDKNIGTEAIAKGAQDYLVKGEFSSDMLTRVISYAIKRDKAKKKIKKSRDKYEKLSKKFKKVSIKDDLTNIANRRHFNSHLKREWKRSIRENETIGLILFDIDHFKVFNDNFGHPAGDKLLKKVAKTASKIFKRPADLIARFGGDEFAAILPNTKEEGVLHLAEKCRKAIKNIEIKFLSSNIKEPITITVGATCIEPSRGLKSEILIKLADQALYKAKGDGRNNVEFMD